MSFIPAEPQSRVALESHNNILLAQFDTPLRIIADRYLAFFRERQSIETTYIDSLRKLYRKAESVDASFDPHAEPTTTRRAWDKVRDNLGRHADAQQTFVDILANDVIKPLELLNESNDKTRKRIERDLKSSAAGYADHAEKCVSTLQQAYLRNHQPVAHRFYPPTLVSDDDCREAVTTLNRWRLCRAEILRDGYDFLEELIFTPAIRTILLKYMDGVTKACAKHDDIARSIGAGVENALTDTSNLKVSFHQALSFSTPPINFYRNYCPGGYSNLIFGVPLVENEVNEEKVPKVMRMCIDEVEKRGLNIDKIYLSGSICDTEVRKLLRRFESEKSFSFTSTDNIHSVAGLLMRYLYDLPEPLLVLSLQEHTQYTNDRDKYTKDNFSLLRSKIHELHPVHRASLEALLRHLLQVTSHSDKNGMTVKVLSSQLCKYVLGYDTAFTGGIDVKRPVMEDLIQNAHTLFDECRSQSPPVPLHNVADSKSTHTSGSFLSAELPQPSEVQATGSNSQHRPGIVDGTPASTRSSFSSFPSDGSVDSRLTPPPIDLLGPLLGLSSSKTLTKGVETTAQEDSELIPEARATKALPNSAPPDVVPLPAPTSVAEWQLHQSRSTPDPDALMIPQSPPESVLSCTSDFPLSSAMSFAD